MAFAIWITGLPGSGKSTIAKELLKLLDKNKIKAEILRLDKIRKKYAPKPRYTDKERDFVYRKFVDEGFRLVKKNKNTIYDATAHKKKYRDYARKNIKNFIEVYVKCTLDVCIKRESKRKAGLVMANMYKKALERKKSKKKYPKLGQVIGVDVPYEENKGAEVKINSNKIRPKQAARIILENVNKRKY
ncbi:adenylyl-sulfate kinase [Candidatus Woesearchaeota archaeon]|nr:adenylyl-sulfate kinase [Candidatus Woesearchaeota archaeon]